MVLSLLALMEQQNLPPRIQISIFMLYYSPGLQLISPQTDINTSQPLITATVGQDENVSLLSGQYTIHTANWSFCRPESNMRKSKFPFSLIELWNFTLLGLCCLFQSKHAWGLLSLRKLTYNMGDRRGTLPNTWCFLNFDNIFWYLIKLVGKTK